MKVREIMTEKVISLKTGDNALAALDRLFEMRISGLPVIDDNGKLAGMFTEKEVTAKILPSYVEDIGKFVYDEDSKHIKQKIINFDKFKVEDIMRREVVTVGDDATLCEALHLMFIQKARRVPVLNRDKEMIGIITRGDVIKALFAAHK